MIIDCRKLQQRFSGTLVYLPALIVSGVLAYKTIQAILTRVGHPAVSLDDTFIHFQYARNLADGHFFTYSPGDGFTAGATSLAWPAVLAVFQLLGFRGLSIVWIAWGLGFIAHAAVTVETYRLARRLTGTATALGAGAMSALFGGFVWFAASGMETVPLAWILVRTARVAADWCEAEPNARTCSHRNELLALGLIAPLIRPEGALASIMAAVVIAAFPGSALKGAWRSRFFALVPLAGSLIPPAIDLALTGSPTSNTSQVKWLPLSPYYPTLATLWDPVRQNVALMFNTLLNGEQWSAIFVPKGSTPFALAALASIPVMGWRSGQRWRAALVLFVALGMFFPCTYMSFLWNRLRYLWPFAPGWFVGLACLARLVGEAASVVRPRWVGIAPMLSGSAAGILGGYLSWTIDDVVQSASAIDRQQVALGRWAKAHLPETAILGVNDTGAIAYMSDRRTFDVVGLTTAGEARYWAAGAGSRFEHYERLVLSQPQRFPTHFIVYPHWMACDAVLGPELHSVSVHDQTILGGVTMVVYSARLDLLGSGARPRQFAIHGDPVDEIDVADLESESKHDYDVLYGGASEPTNRVYVDHPADDSSLGGPWADGGRFRRVADKFRAHLPSHVAVRGIGRFVAPEAEDVVLSVLVDGAPVSTLQLPPGRATEAEFVVPPDSAKSVTRIEVRVLGTGHFGSLHYWFEQLVSP